MRLEGRGARDVNPVIGMKRARMDTDADIDLGPLILDLLHKRQRDYLTVKQVVAGLPAAQRRRLALTASQSTTTLLGKLAPHLGQGLQVYKRGRSSYIGRHLSPEDLILRRIEQRPGVSSKQLGAQLPMAKAPYIAALNGLLTSGAVVCTLRENHTPCLVLAEARQPASEPAAAAPPEPRAAFKHTYDQVGQGGDFVRIHRLREAIGWPREQFDQALMTLMADYTVELHGGDPSILTAAELRDSFTDAHGALYITMSWRGQP